MSKVDKTVVLPKTLNTQGQIDNLSMKIAFVIPWYGKDVGGGAESACRSLVTSLHKIRPDIKVDIITTALKSFANDWNNNVWEEKMYDDEGINVYRFKAKPVSRKLFHKINFNKLMPQTVEDLWTHEKPKSPLTPFSWFWERFYLRHMIISQSMSRFLRKSFHEYDYFFFMPYMFATTYYGSLAVKGKAVIVPCLHNERYAYMNIFQNMMKKATATMFWVHAEQRLANKLYHIDAEKQCLIGAIVDTKPLKGDSARFRQKFNVKAPFMLYAGRKIVGKGVPEMVEYFLTLKNRHASTPFIKDLKLVLIGKGDLEYPSTKYPDIIDLGFVSEQEKQDAYAAATVFCLPSRMESFSIVIMESWLQGVPVMVHDGCEVTRDHVLQSNGGLTYNTQESFIKAVEFMATHPEKAKKMGAEGRSYVIDNYSPERIVEKFVTFLAKLKGSR